MRIEAIRLSIRGVVCSAIRISGAVAAVLLFAFTILSGHTFAQLSPATSKTGMGHRFVTSASNAATPGPLTEKVIHSFSNSGGDGYFPTSGLIADTAGNLYGTTGDGGGAAGGGTVYELSSQANGTWTENVLYNFSTPALGSGPSGELTMDSAGNLYGVTEVGGNEGLGGCDLGCGVVFELSPQENGTWVYQMLHAFSEYDFPGKGGSGSPGATGGLVLDSAGDIFGTTAGGGNLNCNGNLGCGVVYELSPTGARQWNFTILHTFGGPNGNDGYAPSGNLFRDATGSLFGVTGLGPGFDDGGTFYELSPAGNGSWVETILFVFDEPGPVNPNAGLIPDRKGNFYGATGYGGTGNNGAVFELSPQSGGSWSEQVIHNFTGDDGSRPIGPVELDQGATVYVAATQSGLSPKRCVASGINGCGTIIGLAQQADGIWASKILHKFRGAPDDGTYPWGPVIIVNGTLFGATARGGSSSDCIQPKGGCGTVFEIQK